MKHVRIYYLLKSTLLAYSLILPYYATIAATYATAKVYTEWQLV